VNLLLFERMQRAFVRAHRGFTLNQIRNRHAVEEFSAIGTSSVICLRYAALLRDPRVVIGTFLHHCCSRFYKLWFTAVSVRVIRARIFGRRFRLRIAKLSGEAVCNV
jgi:hypothetical protein